MWSWVRSTSWDENVRRSDAAAALRMGLRWTWFRRVVIVVALLVDERVVIMRWRDWVGGLDCMNSLIRRVQVARPSPLKEGVSLVSKN